MRLIVDHIGYAVRNMSKAKGILSILGFSFDSAKTDTYRNVMVMVGKMGGVTVELLSPLEGMVSPIDEILKKNGPMPYHICYRCDDIDETVEELRNIGFIQIGSVARSEPLNGNVVFLYSSEIGVVELIEYQ